MLRWLDGKITQWRLSFFRAFKMPSMPRPPDERVDQTRAEQNGTKKTEKKQPESKQDERTSDVEDCIPRNWLTEKLSLQEVEADNTRLEGGVPFGGQHDKWERLKASLNTDDEVWAFCSPPESWEHHAGRTGVAVVREGRVIDCLVTMMN